MAEKKKRPAIRFKGFEGDWEQRKLGEVARINGRIGFRGYTVKDITSKEKGGVLAYSPSNIINNQLYINNGNTYITRNKYEESPEIMISNGDILFVKTGSTLGKSTLVKGLQEDATLNPQVIVIRVKKNIEQFFSAMLITKRIFRQVESSKIGGAVPTITETQIKNFDIIQPFFDEEKRKIGMFFSNLDHLITLHQRKHEKLKIFKKAMLEKMFPKNGEKIPEVRLPGFEGDWEQRKLDDFLIGRNEQIPMSTEYPLMAFVAYEGVSPKGERYDRSFLVSDVENKLYKKTELGDFIYSSNNLEAGSIGLNKYGKATISPVYSIFHSTSLADSDFLGRRLIQKDIVNAMIRWRQGVIYGQWRIHESDFLKIEIYAPSFQEQLEIGAFFDNLDHLITLHQRKVEKLQIVKESMLEKMFV